MESSEVSSLPPDSDKNYPEGYKLSALVIADPWLAIVWVASWWRSSQLCRQPRAPVRHTRKMEI